MMIRLASLCAEYWMRSPASTVPKMQGSDEGTARTNPASPRHIRCHTSARRDERKPRTVVSFDELDAPEPDGSLVSWMREVPPLSIVLGVQQPVPADRTIEKIDVLATAFDTGSRNRGTLPRGAHLLHFVATAGAQTTSRDVRFVVR